MTKVTNETGGPRAVHTAAGEVFFAKGETKDVTFAPGGITAARMIGLDVDGEEGEVETDTLNIDEALEAARREVAEAAQAEMDRRQDAFTSELETANERAEAAEKDLEAARIEIAALKAAASSKPDLPGLAGKNKAELIEIAKAEGVEIEDGATNDDIKSAIELHREG